MDRGENVSARQELSNALQCLDLIIHHRMEEPGCKPQSRHLSMLNEVAEFLERD